MEIQVSCPSCGGSYFRMVIGNKTDSMILVDSLQCYGCYREWEVFLAVPTDMGGTVKSIDLERKQSKYVNEKAATCGRCGNTTLKRSLDGSYTCSICSKINPVKCPACGRNMIERYPGRFVCPQMCGAEEALGLERTGLRLWDLWCKPSAKQAEEKG